MKKGRVYMSYISRSLAAAALVASVAFGASAQDAADVDTSSIVEMQLGNAEAPVTVIEYASYTCPHCANFHENGFKQLKEDFIDEGRINFVYREVFFDRPGLWASIVARCGEGAENRFFGITELLYEKQDDLRDSDPAVVVENLKTIGRTAGLTDSDMDACLQDADNAQTLYARFLQTTEADGIRSTPTFVINGESVPNSGYDDLKAAIEDALADAE